MSKKRSAAGTKRTKRTPKPLDAETLAWKRVKATLLRVMGTHLSNTKLRLEINAMMERRVYQAIETLRVYGITSNEESNNLAERFAKASNEFFS